MAFTLALTLTLVAACDRSPTNEIPVGPEGPDRIGSVRDLTVKSNVQSGSYNVPQEVVLTSTGSSSIYYTLDGSDPVPRKSRTYEGPIYVGTDARLRAISVLEGARSAVLALDIMLLEKPTLIEDGQFLLGHPNPIHQTLTRTAFMSGGGVNTIHFSTLESPRKIPNERRFLIYEYDVETKTLSSVTVGGGIEARTHAYASALEKYVLGTSLGPQILVYDPSTQILDTIFSMPNLWAFIHRVAVHGQTAYTILSSVSPIRGFEGILTVDLTTKSSKIIPFSERMDQNWGGVQTVDPTGRIWFYRAYPLKLKWYDAAEGIRKRLIPGYEGWTVESWDVWGDDYFLILTNPEGDFVKRMVDLTNLNLIEQGDLSEATKQFMGLIPVDLYHQGGPAISGLYFSPERSEFYNVDAVTQTISYLGQRTLGNFETLGTRGDLMEEPVRWVHPTFWRLEVLGLTDDGNLLVWRHSQKIHAVIDWSSSELAMASIPAPNLSPADIASNTLVTSEDGTLYGSGTLTISDLFKYDPDTGESLLLPGAIPFGVGQINSMFRGVYGNLYGAGYPGSVLFKYDPKLPWNPGQAASDNPVNIGPMGYHNQMRAARGIQDLDGNVWYQSHGDYAHPVVYALAKTDFSDMTLDVRTNIDDGFPIVEDLAIFNEERIVLLGRSGDSHKLYLLDQREFVIKQEQKLTSVGGVLVTFNPRTSHSRRTYLAQHDMLYRVNADLSLTAVHKSRGTITKILQGDQGDMLLLGKNHIEMVNNRTGDWEVWWDKNDKEGLGLVSSDHKFLPAVYRDGRLFIADREKLREFVPPSGSNLKTDGANASGVKTNR